jgi:hypothetical protein
VGNTYVLARYPRGLRVPARLELAGEIRSFGLDWCDRKGNVLFHFNPRGDEGEVVLNARIGGRWGEEERVGRWPFADEGLYRLSFDVLGDRFAVSVDGTPFCEFRHRRPPRTITHVRSLAPLHPLTPGGRARAQEIVVDEPERHAWVRAEQNPPRPLRRRLRSLRLFAVLGAWMEEDIVPATVANCLRQGCERVYLVDNDSPDRTVERAVAAGAVHARTFATQRFDERERMRQLQSVVEEVSAAEADDHAWWLFLDADEFYHGPRGVTLREYLQTLDRRFRIVGARAYHHVPSGEPAYVEGRHPLDFQPLCYLPPAPWYCAEGHWKHPLLRWDRDGAPLAIGGSFHTAVCEETLLEPLEPVVCRHFPYREQQTTRRRLERLFGLDGSTDRTQQDIAYLTQHMELRLNSVSAIYDGRFEEAQFLLCARGLVPELKPWDEWVAPEERQVARWY